MPQQKQFSRLILALALSLAPSTMAEEHPKSAPPQVAQVATAPPSVQTEAPMESAPRVAQVAAENPSAPAVALGDNRQATLGDINRLDGKIDNLSAAINSNFRWTLALIIALLGLPQLPGWFRAFRGAPTAAAALLAASLLASPMAWAETATPPVSQWVTGCEVSEMNDETFCSAEVFAFPNTVAESKFAYICSDRMDGFSVSPDFLAFQFDYLNLANVKFEGRRHPHAYATTRWGKDDPLKRKFSVHDRSLQYAIDYGQRGFGDVAIKRLATEKFEQDYLLRLQLRYYKDGSPVFKYPLFGSAEAIAKARAGCGISK